VLFNRGSAKHVVGFTTVARKFSIGGLCVSAGWLDALKIDKNSTDLQCFMFQFGGLGSFVWGAKPPKAPRGDGTGGVP